MTHINTEKKLVVAGGEEVGAGEGEVQASSDGTDKPRG